MVLVVNYYLDVDGTIITKDHQEVLELNGFLKYLFNTGEVYWLTTHCRYENVLSYIKPSIILSLSANFGALRKLLSYRKEKSTIFPKKDGKANKSNPLSYIKNNILFSQN